MNSHNDCTAACSQCYHSKVIMIYQGFESAQLSPIQPFVLAIMMKWQFVHVTSLQWMFRCYLSDSLSELFMQLYTTTKITRNVY